MSDQKESWRRHYPLLKKGLYLKNASISAMHDRTLEAINLWNESVGNQAAINEQRFFEFLMEVHAELAQFLNCPQEDVTLLENSSHNMNLLAMMLTPEREAGKNEIIMAADEFPSNALPFFHHGFEMTQVSTHNGSFSPEDLFAKVTDKTVAVICSTVQFSTGQVTDPEKLSKLAEEHNVHLILNATQSLGVIPLDLSKLNILALTSSCHKWLGAGIGAAIFYLNPEFRKEREYPMAGWCSVEEPFAMRNEKPVPRNDVMALQLGSLPFAVLAGVSQAIKEVQRIGVQNIHDSIIELTDYLRAELIKRELTPMGDGGSGIVTFGLSKTLEETEEFVHQLEQEKIYVNCRRGLIRVSPHYYNTKVEIEGLLERIDLVLKA